MLLIDPGLAAAYCTSFRTRPPNPPPSSPFGDIVRGEPFNILCFCCLNLPPAPRLVFEAGILTRQGGTKSKLRRETVDVIAFLRQIHSDQPRPGF